MKTFVNLECCSSALASKTEINENVMYSQVPVAATLYPLRNQLISTKQILQSHPTPLQSAFIKQFLACKETS
jgi:hypothetical protein